MRCRWLPVLALGLAIGIAGPWQAHGEPACRVVTQEKRVEIRSPRFTFCLDTSDGLRALSWENRLTSRNLSLGKGPELEIDLGQPGGSLETPRLEVTSVEVKGQGEAGEIVFHLAAKEPAAAATVTYRWDAKLPVLRKFVEIVNSGGREWNRLLNVRLGTYRTEAKRAGGGQGFPVYLDDDRFLSLAHPAGMATSDPAAVSLRQHPGMKLVAGKSYPCMEVIYGVTEAGQARPRFAAYVQGRSRRVARGHDRPYAIFEPFGARPGGDFNETEEFLLDNIAKVAQGQRESSCHFDYYSIDFWVDFHGDIKKCDPKRFPNGLVKIKEELKKLGTAPGLWIDSGGLPAWTVGGNPAVKGCFSEEGGKGGLCRATEPIKSMYVEGFRHHIRENGVRLLKFDNLLTSCSNPKHSHLPGAYSTEAIHDSLIEFLHALDAECPDVFLMLYWGYRSPWWLLHADTYFDSGIGIEAASPADLPAPYIRDSVTQKLDQAQWRANEDVPPLGKDSLGVWLSDWSWNSQVGKERWQAGFLMDLCRGSLLAQPWSDTPWLSPPERAEMAEFLALFKARPECFINSRFILGDPWKNEPYGYCCTDGKRAFLALHNCCWRDSVLPLALNAAWGLPDGQAWDLYRWYPEPARLQQDAGSPGKPIPIALRPFEIVLLEAVPRGEAPSLDRRFEFRPIPVGFVEPSRELPLTVRELDPEKPSPEEAIWKALPPVEARSAGGATLKKLPDGSLLAGGKNPAADTYTIKLETELTGITAIRLEALPDPSLPDGGPGRAMNGNFALDELRVRAWPKGNAAAAAAVPLRNPVADFSQEGYGGWPVTAAIDGDPKTGWSIDPMEALPHTAIFHLQQPAGVAGSTTLELTLEQGGGVAAEHQLGRFRLSVTTAKPPLPTPRPIGPGAVTIKGEISATQSGGTLVVSAEMRRGSAPMYVGGPGKYFSAEGTLSGEKIVCRPVIGTATYPSSWQAWRIAVAPSAESRAVELTITPVLSREVKLTWKGHFVPH